MQTHYKNKLTIQNSLSNWLSSSLQVKTTATRSARHSYYTVVWDHMKCFQSCSEGIYYLWLYITLIILQAVHNTK